MSPVRVELRDLEKNRTNILRETDALQQKRDDLCENIKRQQRDLNRVVVSLAEAKK